MERIFNCPQCEKGFKELRTLRLHLKIHNAEYPERCLVCQKVFRTKWQLKQHQMDHGGERPYPCPECSFTCKTKQQLNEHRRKHSGEKAYCCALCGTRFTYRNGLIKHTKLNRCPKKIITPEGETIIKKRSRVIPKTPPVGGSNLLPSSSSSSSSSSLSVSPVLNLQMSVAVAEAVNNVMSATQGNALDHKIMEVLRRNSSSKGLSPERPPRANPSPEKILSDPLPSPMNPGSPIIESPLQISVEDVIRPEETIPNPREIHDVSNSFNLALLDEGSNHCLVSTTCTLPTQTITTKAHPPSASSPLTSTSTSSSTVIAHNGILPPNTINELSAATGLSSSEICSWASTLPAGALVKVTHHYNTSIQPSGSILQQPQIIEANRIEDNGDFVANNHQLMTQQQHLAPALLAGALKNSSVGLLSYQEVFAVDPNEVLQKSLSKSTLLTTRRGLKNEEPHTTSSTLEDFIDLGIFSPEDPSVIKEEPLSPNGSDSGFSNHSYYINSGRLHTEQNHPPLSDIDLGLSECLSTPHHSPLEDDTLSVLNDQDFSSMKSIVEQTFTDGREIMDVISAV